MLFSIFNYTKCLTVSLHCLYQKMCFRHQPPGSNWTGQAAVELSRDCGCHFQQAWSWGSEESIASWHSDTGNVTMWKKCIVFIVKLLVNLYLVSIRWLTTNFTEVGPSLMEPLTVCLRSLGWSWCVWLDSWGFSLEHLSKSGMVKVFILNHLLSLNHLEVNWFTFLNTLKIFLLQENYWTSIHLCCHHLREWMPKSRPCRLECVLAAARSIL